MKVNLRGIYLDFYEKIIILPDSLAGLAPEGIGGDQAVANIPERVGVTFGKTEFPVIKIMA